jgi:hypothetical protein
MKRKITFMVTGCDYPKCKRTVLNGMMTTFKCGHSCCTEHVIKGKTIHDQDKCGVCAKKKVNKTIERG